MSWLRRLQDKMKFSIFNFQWLMFVESETDAWWSLSIEKVRLKYQYQCVRQVQDSIFLKQLYCIHQRHGLQINARKWADWRSMFLGTVFDWYTCRTSNHYDTVDVHIYIYIYIQSFSYFPNISTYLCLFICIMYKIIRCI